MSITNTNITHGEYVGPGIYTIGEYGINLCYENDLPDMIKSLRLLGEEGHEDDEFDLDFDIGEGGEAYIEKLEGEEYDNDFEDIYIVCPIIPGENIHYQMLRANTSQEYYGTGHSIFGSGNVHIKHKGKIKFKS